jgi:hypothetical protein
MARKVFYSFHFKPDNWRVSQVRNIGAIEDNKPAPDNDWEAIKASGDQAIKSWINNQMKGRTCAIVLIGEKTAGRKWIEYEIKKSWNDGKGLLGIYIHNLKNKDGEQSNKGKNPFDGFTVGDNKKTLSSIVKTYDPPSSTSTKVYEYIKENLETWVGTAIDIRNSYS